MDRGAWWATVHGLEKNITSPLSLCPPQPPPTDFAFPSGLNGKESVCSAGDPSLIPGLGRCPGEGNGNPFQYSCMENPMDRGAWWPTVHGMEKSWTWFEWLTHSLKIISVLGHYSCIVRASTESFKEQHSHFLVTSMISILILARAKETKWFRQNLGKSQSQALVLLLCSLVTKWPPEYSFSFLIFYWFSISKLERKEIPESLLDIKPEVSGTIIVVSVLDYISNVE